MYRCTPQKDSASPTLKRQMSLLRACAADRMAPGTPPHAEPLSLDMRLTAEDNALSPGTPGLGFARSSTLPAVLSTRYRTPLCFSLPLWVCLLYFKRAC